MSGPIHHPCPSWKAQLARFPGFESITILVPGCNHMHLLKAQLLNKNAPDDSLGLR